MTKIAFRRGMILILALAAFGLAACTHATPTTHPSDAPRSAPISPSTPGTHPAALATQCPAHARAGSQPVVFQGTTTGKRYCGLVWTSDEIHDCAKHAHGARMIAFLKKHTCGPTGRVLATVFARHDAINVSSIETSFSGTPRNPFGAQLQFTNLVKSPSGGNIDDLLREGHRMPGPHGRMSAHAVLGVFTIGQNINVIDTWYRNKPTPNNDYNLRLVEADLKLSRLLGGG